MSEPPPLFAGTIVLTALLLSFLTIASQLSNYTSAYLTAPTEILPFIDACQFSIQENESYDLDITKIERLEDKVRLHALYREIQRNGDELREELDRLLVAREGTTLRTAARLLWREKRKGLEERMRRGDMLRMRFLVVYLGLIASSSHAATNTSTLQKDPEKWSLPMAREIPKAPALPMPPMTPGSSPRPKLTHAMTEELVNARKGGPPLRRLATQAMGHSSNVGKATKPHWGNVIDELQKSPLLHRRRESIEIDEILRRAQSQSP